MSDGADVALLEDGSLRLFVEAALAEAAARWIPLLPRAASVTRPAGGARIIASVATGEQRVDAGARLFSLDGVVARAGSDDLVRLFAPETGCAGAIDLRGRVAELWVPKGNERSAGAARDLHSMLTASAALLVGRLGGAVLHAAAVVSEGGGAWILVGDTHAGKSTTTVSLIGAGWDWMSDDQVVLTMDASGRPVIEGWPRTFHLDEGWRAKTPAKRRGDIDPSALGPGQWRRRASLERVVLLRVAPDEPTSLSPASSADVLTALVRQSPWLMADRTSAPHVLELLRTASGLSLSNLRLGKDTFGYPDRLVDALRGGLRP